MKALVYLSFIGLLSILLLTSAQKPPQNTYSYLKNFNSFDNGIYFNPQKFYVKQCTFCHNESGKIAPSMNIIKKEYLDAYPKKKDFVKKMTRFIINPTEDNRLIKENQGKYKEMPSDMFYDVKKIQKVCEYIFDKIEMPSKSQISGKTNIYRRKKPIKNSVQVNIELQKGANLCEIMNLHSVDFDFAKATVNNAMKKQLNKLIIFLKENPTIKIEIRNHTDSRGTAQHNLKLSNKRAYAIKNYIVSHGINPNRVKAKGYGEKQLLNHCKDGVKCSEELHKQNRRTEIIIL